MQRNYGDMVKSPLSHDNVFSNIYIYLYVSDQSVLIGSEDILNNNSQLKCVIEQELEVRSLNHPYSLKTRSSQCHYVMTPCAFGFEAI